MVYDFFFQCAVVELLSDIAAYISGIADVADDYWFRTVRDNPEKICVAKDIMCVR